MASPMPPGVASPSLTPLSSAPSAVSSPEGPLSYGTMASSSSSSTAAAVYNADTDADPLLDPRENSPSNDDTATDSSTSRTLLIVTYGGLLLVAFTTSLEAQVTAPLVAFAVSSFHNHSMLSTVYVVQGVVNAVIKPPMAKMAHTFGHLKAFAIAVLLCVTGYVQMACSPNIQTFAAAQILYSAGVTGLQALQQILVAETSDLRHRALLSSLPNTPFLITVWIGPSIAAAVLHSSSWRWGYAMWAVILPIAFLPLGSSLALSASQVKAAAKQGHPRHQSCLGLTLRPQMRKQTHIGDSSNPSSSNDTGDPDDNDSNDTQRHPQTSSLLLLLHDLDAVGILLLSCSLSLILLPLTIANKVDGGWSSAPILFSMTLGFVLLVTVFPAWESRPRWAPYPLIPLVLMRSVTFCAGCGVAFFFFAVFYLSIQPYFYSYLLVAHNMAIPTAGRITQIFAFASTISAVIASVAIRHVRRYKVFVVSGACLYLAGVSCMLVYRTADAGTVRLVVTQMAVGLGAGMMSVPTQIGVQAASAAISNDAGSPRHAKSAAVSGARLVAAATAVYLTMGEAGGAVGAAISGAFWGRMIPTKLAAYLPEHARPNASAIYASVEMATSYPWGSPERDAIVRAYQEAMTTLLTVAVVFCVPVVLLSLLMYDYRFDGDSKTHPSRTQASSLHRNGPRNHGGDRERLLGGETARSPSDRPSMINRVPTDVRCV